MICECAAILQIDVGPYTLRQLVAMSEYRLQAEWDHTAYVCAAIYNARMGVKKSQMVSPLKLNPYRKSRRTGKREPVLQSIGKAFGVEYPKEWKQ